ncbi:Conserved_hypothetical protein [Hexamita inflata]|uniref:Thioredoxin domain-containing protein n=1 Tax=Hexamita inflata TaxID=28002 RepID=A0AA86Q7U6_9EUKA|nr:Conserved hypothetical protein [Hexamita inflata]
MYDFQIVQVTFTNISMCQFCDEMMDIMEDVADYFEDYEDELVIGHANCRIKPEICANHKITEHPTLLLWKGGRQALLYSNNSFRFVVGLIDIYKSGNYFKKQYMMQYQMKYFVFKYFISIFT